MLKLTYTVTFVKLSTCSTQCGEHLKRFFFLPSTVKSVCGTIPIKKHGKLCSQLHSILVKLPWIIWTLIFSFPDSLTLQLWRDGKEVEKGLCPTKVCPSFLCLGWDFLTYFLCLGWGFPVSFLCPVGGLPASFLFL